MIILIGISIILPLIHNTIAKKRKHYKEPIDASKFIKTSNSYPRTENNYTVMKKDSFIDKVLTDNVNNQMSIKDNFETKHGLFENFNKSVSRCNNNDDFNLDLCIDQDLFDVSSLSLTNYFEFNPDELEKILNEEIIQKNKENYIIKDMVIPKHLKNNKVENEFKTVNLKNYLPTKKILDNSLIENDVILDSDKQIQTNFNDKNTNERKKFNILISPVLYDMKQYIKSNITKYYQSFYLQILEGTTNDIKLLEELKLELEEQKFIFSSYDQELEEKLRSILTKFRKNSTFNQETCYLLRKEFKLHINEIAVSHYYKWYYFSNQKKVLTFYCEFMKLYRYVYHIPEILTLGGLVIGKLHRDPAFIFHLMNVFIEKIGKPEENKVFIKCLINKAFSYSPKDNINMFLVSKFYIKCHNNHKNLQFFSWKIHRDIRQRMKRKTSKKNHYEIDYKVISHMKVVLLLFLYQHIIFLKFYNVKIGDIDIFIDFIRRVIKSKECVMCIFDDFLEIVRGQTKKL